MNTDQQVEMPLLDTEAAILFGLKGRQVIILACSVAVGYSVWQSVAALQSIVGVVLLVCFCVMPAVLIAFLTLGGRSLDRWLFLIIAWVFVPDHMSFKSFLTLFMKVKSLRDGIVTLQVEGQRIDYQAIVCVEPRAVDLLSGAEQAVMIEAFGRMLDGLSYPISIHIRSVPHRPHTLNATIVSEQLARPLRRLHAHYLSFVSQLVQETRPVSVCFYITIPATIQGEKDEGRRATQAKGQLVNRIQQISRELARAGLSCRSLTSAELFSFYRDAFTMTQMLAHDDLDLDLDLADDTQLPAMLVPPLTMSLEASSCSFHTTGGAQYMSCLELDAFPRHVYPGWLSHVITELREPYIDMSLHIQPHESDQVALKLKRKAVVLGGALLAAKQQGDEGGNTLTRYALKDVERVRDQLQQGGHMYSVALVVRVEARSREELHKREEHIQLAMRSLDMHVRRLRFQQHLGYLSTLGYGQNLLHSHLLPTDAVASFYPFVHVPTMESGVLLGTSRNGNLVSLDPYAAERLNANLAVLGIPGSGKSFCLKVLLSRLAASTIISIIDVEDEYFRFIQAVGGQRIKLTADSLHMNPLELTAAGGQTFREKIAMLVGFFALLIGDNGELSRQESAMLEHCLLKVYAACGITADPATHTRPAPMMQNVADALQREASGYDLALRLTASLHLFPRRSSLHQSGKHTVYSLAALPEVLRPAATYLLTERLWSQLQAGRQDDPDAAAPPRQIIVIDEAWFLSKFEAGTTLLNDFARRIRKYNGGLWLGTQQLTDLLATEQGKNLLALCETKMLFRQDVSSIDAMRMSLHLSAAQAQYLSSARQGEALMMTSKDTRAIDVIASEQETALAVTSQQHA